MRLTEIMSSYKARQIKERFSDVETVEDANKLTDEQLLSCRSIGKIAIQKIRRAACQQTGYGLQYGNSPPLGGYGIPLGGSMELKPTSEHLFKNPNMTEQRISQVIELIKMKVEINKMKSDDYIWNNNAFHESVKQLKKCEAVIDDLLNREPLLGNKEGG